MSYGLTIRILGRELLMSPKHSNFFQRRWAHIVHCSAARWIYESMQECSGNAENWLAGWYTTSAEFIHWGQFAAWWLLLSEYMLDLWHVVLQWTFSTKVRGFAIIASVGWICLISVAVQWIFLVYDGGWSNPCPLWNIWCFNERLPKRAEAASPCWGTTP